MDGPEIPPYFICPISLQLMKDPVTISTGVSYDRDSIESWISEYDHSTCPVTNQSLSDHTLTPNSTLLRLIHSWTTNPNTLSQLRPSMVPKAPATTDASEILNNLVDAKLDPNLQLKSLKKARGLVQDDPNINVFMEKCGVTSLVSSLILQPQLSETPHINDRQEVIAEATILLQILKPSPQKLRQLSESNNGELVMSLSLILQRGPYRARVHAALLLKSIFKEVGDACKTDLPTELFDGIVEILKDQNSNQATTMALLSILMEVVPYGRNRAKAVDAGAVPVIVELLMEGEDRRRCEAMLRVLELVCLRAEGRVVLLAHPAGVATVVAKMLRVSMAATEKAVKILLLLCRCSGGRKVVEEIMEVGGVAKICMVVQVEGSGKAKQRAKEILGMHMKEWSMYPCFPSHCLP